MPKRNETKNQHKNPKSKMNWLHANNTCIARNPPKHTPPCSCPHANAHPHTKCATHQLRHLHKYQKCKLPHGKGLGAMAHSNRQA